MKEPGEADLSALVAPLVDEQVKKTALPNSSAASRPQDVCHRLLPLDVLSQMKFRPMGSSALRFGKSSDKK